MSFINPSTTTTTTVSSFSFGTPVAQTAPLFDHNAPMTTATTAPTAPTATTLPTPVNQPSFGFGTGQSSFKLPSGSSSSTSLVSLTTASSGTGTTPSLSLFSSESVKDFSFASSPSLVPPNQASSTQQQSTSLTTTPSAVKKSSVMSLSTATKTTESGDAKKGVKYNFTQLDEQINKWTLELDEQEKHFINQATQVNLWDKLLVANNDKITTLSVAIQEVQREQDILEQELEFISTQQVELEESVLSLEKEIHTIPSDVDRSQLYNLVENMDTQLKQMAEDLREVVDYLNDGNKSQDMNDPMVQIVSILNSHITSLQMIDSSTSDLTTKLDNIAKMHEYFKAKWQKSLRSTYFD